MNATAESEPAVIKPKGARIAKIVQRSARFTSIPVLALVLIALLPAMGSFSVSAREDKILALALGGTLAGFLLGWKWAGIGGAISLASIGVMLTQSDVGAYGDPFTIAFGLQGILFLLSWVLNLQADTSRGPAILWFRRVGVSVLALGALAGAAVIIRGPGPTPLPRDKEVFVGAWENGTGFKLEITSAGQASVTRAQESKIDPWNTPVGPGATGVFNLSFHGDEQLELTSGPLGNSKAYHIDRRPHKAGKLIRMVLNGSEPYKPSSGVDLVKKDTAGADTQKPEVKGKK
jgi:hypothetical protein